MLGLNHGSKRKACGYVVIPSESNGTYEYEILRHYRNIVVYCQKDGIVWHEEVRQKCLGRPELRNIQIVSVALC